MTRVAIVNSTFGGACARVPVGPLLIVSALEAAGHTVDFYDYQLAPGDRKPDPEHFLQFLRRVDAQVVGINALCTSLPTTLAAIARLKQERPEVTVILGGPSATDLSLPILERFPVDVIVRGEGEETVVELLAALGARRSLEAVRGLAFRDGHAVRVTPDRARIRDLDRLPLPAYHHINLNDYGRRAILMTTRGCPYLCSFCSAHSVWRRQVTYRSASHVMAELRALRGQADRIEIWDDTFVLDPDRVYDMMDAMHAEGIDLPWTAGGRINLMTPELMADMARGGCAEIFYGIESGSDRVLERIHKQFDTDTARRVIDQSARYFERVNTSYIWGYPFESLEDFYDTVTFLVGDMKDPRVAPQMTLLTPLPASPLCQEYRCLLRFSPDIQMGASTLPGDQIGSYPELAALVEANPELFSSFYYYDHPAMDAKRSIVQKLIEQNRQTRQSREGGRSA